MFHYFVCIFLASMHIMFCLNIYMFSTFSMSCSNSLFATAHSFSYYCYCYFHIIVISLILFYSILHFLFLFLLILPVDNFKYVDLYIYCFCVGFLMFLYSCFDSLQLYVTSSFNCSSSPCWFISFIPLSLI